MKQYKNKLCCLSLFAFALSIIAGFDAMASAMERPEWVSKREWVEPPLFDVKHSFFVDSSSHDKLGDIKNGMLSCKVMVRDDLKLDWTPFGNGSPELFFKVVIAGHKSIRLHGSGYGYIGWFYIKSRELKVDQLITVHVEDWDQFSANEVVGDMQINYRGERIFSSNTANINLRCIVSNAAMLKQKTERQLKMFHQFAKKSAASLLAYPTRSFSEEKHGMQERILGLAALSGWESPAVQDATQVYNVIINVNTGIEHTVKARFLAQDRPKAGVPIPLPNTTLEVFVKTVECGEKTWRAYQALLSSSSEKEIFKKSTCIVKVGIRNTGREMELRSFSNWYGKRPYYVLVINGNTETFSMKGVGFVTTQANSVIVDKMQLQKNKETIALFIPLQPIVSGAVVVFKDGASQGVLLSTKK